MLLFRVRLVASLLVMAGALAAAAAPAPAATFPAAWISQGGPEIAMPSVGGCAPTPEGEIDCAGPPADLVVPAAPVATPGELTVRFSARAERVFVEYELDADPDGAQEPTPVSPDGTRWRLVVPAALPPGTRLSFNVAFATHADPDGPRTDASYVVTAVPRAAPASPRPATPSLSPARRRAPTLSVRAVRRRGRTVTATVATRVRGRLWGCVQIGRRCRSQTFRQGGARPGRYLVRIRLGAGLGRAQVARARLVVRFVARASGRSVAVRRALTARR